MTCGIWKSVQLANVPSIYKSWNSSLIRLDFLSEVHAQKQLRKASFLAQVSGFLIRLILVISFSTHWQRNPGVYLRTILDNFNLITTQVSSIIPSPRPTIPRVTITILTGKLFTLRDFETDICKKKSDHYRPWMWVGRVDQHHFGEKETQELPI